MTNMVPAIAFVGRSNSGKTTLVVQVIAELTSRGFRVGSVKHHGHQGFDIDIQGKDSWRHTQAGSQHTVIVSPQKVASYQNITPESEPSLEDVLLTMSDCDIVVVEGFKHNKIIPSIELIRKDNVRDQQIPLDERELIGVALVTDREDAAQKAQAQAMPVFSFNDISALVDFVVREVAL